jgi:HTH-type transcriptional regulator/antitoxin HigA
MLALVSADDANRPSPPHPGKTLKMHLDAKGWTHDELSAITGWSRQSISAVIGGRSSITPSMAIALGAAFDNDPSEWLRWNSQYELAIAEIDPEVIARRARIFSVGPIKEMQKREWVPDTADTAELERALVRFFGGPLDAAIQFQVAAKRTIILDELNLAERAWSFRAHQLARVVPVEAPFLASRLGSAEKLLRQAAAFPKEARKVQRILSEHGIRFVVIEPLPGVKMDGAAFWLDDISPVIAISARHDRIDTFWFTLMHEFKHIEHGDAFSFDSNLINERDGKITILLSGDAAEQKANDAASAALIPADELNSFIRRLAPLYSKERIIQFAHRMRIHPGIIVGQLQYRGELGYSAHRELLVKIRSIITETALTDGWGHSISPTLV